MKIETGAQSRFNSISIKVETPHSSDLFVHIMENESGEPCGVHLNIGKTGGELHALVQGVGRLCSKIFDLGGTVSDIIEELSNHTTDRTYNKGNGIVIRSVVDAFVHALVEYQRDKYRERIKLLDTTPRLGG